MPELPEVETTLRGIKPYIVHQIITDVVIRHYGLRWPVQRDIRKTLQSCQIQAVDRRGKYLLLHLTRGSLIVHLGMSGSLRILTQNMPAKKHDHIDVIFANGCILRFTDPRRFGAFIWTESSLSTHFLLKDLGLEPLSKNFTGSYLQKLARNRKVAIKSFIMNSKVVVGVGNIYANEALFVAGIHPNTPAKNISAADYANLVLAIKAILKKAIRQGGTTLRNFLNSKGKPGYFSQHLAVYGREGLACIRCKTILQANRLGQRTTVFCPCCQK